MSTVKIKIQRNFGDIFKVAKETGQLWVVNTSDLGKTQRRGDVSLSVRDPAGQEIPIMLIATWLPIDLASHTGIEAYEKSDNFRTYVRKGILGVITADMAKSIQELDRGGVEAERVAKTSQGLRNAIGVMSGDGNMQEIELNTTSQNTITDTKTVSSKEDLMDGNTPQVKDMLARVEKTPGDKFGEIHDSLVNFFTQSTDLEVKALASGISDVNSPAFNYVDATLEAFSAGTAVDAALFEGLRSKAPESQDAVTFAIG